MYSCPNCAAALRFSIETQDLFCDHCDSHFGAYDFEKLQDAEFHDTGMYETQVFTCPSCGGEISSTDTTAAGFCSYCGSPTILSARIQKEQAPDAIIPFTVTKEQCIKSYKKFIKKGIFAPSGMLKESHLDQFRGIYMPYWNFNLSQNNIIHLETNRSYRVGDYIHYEKRGISARLEAQYSGITFDSSSSFSDTISERIAPYDVHQSKKFTPAYLLGFYADIADVPSSFYTDQAEAEARADLHDFVSKDPQIAKVPGTLDHSKINSQLVPTVTKVDTVMFPVWFLSYRYKDRIAYATVNGQTGKIAGDLPISTGKYLLFSAVIAVILFVLLNLFFTFKPVNLLYCVMIISIITMILYHLELKKILRQDLYQEDVGYLYKTRDQSREETAEEMRQAIIMREKSYSRENAITGKAKGAKGWFQKTGAASHVLSGIIIFFSIFGVGGIYLIQSFGRMPVEIAKAFASFFSFFHIGNIGTWLFLLAAVVVLVVLSVNQWKMQRTILRGKAHIPGVFISGSALVIATLNLAINPVSDLWYYGATLAAIVLEFFALIQLIRYYNYLATRKLPQYYLYEGDEWNETL